MSAFIKIDELTIGEHYYLDATDDCYYLFNYTPHKDYDYSESNQLISNLKKKVSQKGATHYKYKEIAIRKAAIYIRKALNKEFISNVTFVPIPPSKCKEHPEYDDRMLRILNLVVEGEDGDIRELIEQKESTKAFHLSAVRPSIYELQDNLKLIIDECDNLRETICLVDDMITSGTHFKAIKKIIQRKFPDIHVIGIFICRREIERIVADEFDDDF